MDILFKNYIWNENKCASNLAKHGFDFRRADEIIEGNNVILESSYPDEVRFVAVGRMGNDIVAVVFTMRNGKYRIISIRKARNGERREFSRVHVQ